MVRGVRSGRVVLGVLLFLALLRDEARGMLRLRGARTRRGLSALATVGGGRGGRCRPPRQSPHRVTHQSRSLRRRTRLAISSGVRQRRCSIGPTRCLSKPPGERNCSPHVGHSQRFEPTVSRCRRVVVAFFAVNMICYPHGPPLTPDAAGYLCRCFVAPCTSFSPLRATRHGHRSPPSPLSTPCPSPYHPLPLCLVLAYPLLPTLSSLALLPPFLPPLLSSPFLLPALIARPQTGETRYVTRQCCGLFAGDRARVSASAARAGVCPRRAIPSRLACDEVLGLCRDHLLKQGVQRLDMRRDILVSEREVILITELARCHAHGAAPVDEPCAAAPQAV